MNMESNKAHTRNVNLNNRQATYQKNMKVLANPNDKIEVGIYAGETLHSILKYYGKKAFPEILRYYDISDEILKEHHCQLVPHEDRSEEAVPVQDWTKTNMKEDESLVDVTDQDEMTIEGEETPILTGNIADDYNSWTSSRSDYENNVLYDPEDDLPNTIEDIAMMAKGGAHLYWDGELLHQGTAVFY